MLKERGATTKFNINAAEYGDVMGNKVSNFNVWSPSGVPEQANFVNADPMQFVEYIQLMQATGGSVDRDLFADPLNRAVLDDYDFSPLITACRNVLKLGATPHIKTGNVPLKFTTDPEIGVFGVNVNPPDDYDRYYTYIADIARALVDEFGLSEVRSWRFGVLTEFENADWFMAKSGDPDETFTAYCKLYDYTLAALQSVLGKEIDIGAHAMAVSEGLWDEGRFIEHCARGTNYYTGEIGSRLCFLAASYYDNNPASLSKRTPAAVIKALRDKAESVGLAGLFYGFDEGRILSSRSGSVDQALLLRIVGQTYQASYDAKLLKQLADNDIDYFSSWGMTTDPTFGGYPSVAYHVAEKYAALLAGRRQLTVQKTASGWTSGAESELLAGIDPAAKTIGLMAYNYKADLDYCANMTLTINIGLPDDCGDKVKVTCYLIDDEANFFDEWEADRQALGIGDDCFAWSCDDPGVESYTTLNDAGAREIYFTQLRDKYIECARLVPAITALPVSGNAVSLNITLPPHAVVFYDIAY